jgi:AcrR family transcriptional regulator
MRETDSPTLRDEHVAATRQRIVDAVIALMTEEHPAALSVPAVARRAGVSVATVYRHFPNKEQLLDAVAFIGTDVVRPGPIDSLDDLEEFTTANNHHVQPYLPMIRAQFATEVGQDVRRRRLAPRVEAARALLAKEGIEVDAPEGERLVRLALTLLSSITLIELTSNHGLGVDEASREMTWAVQSLVAVTRTEQRRRTGTTTKRRA